MAAIFQDGRHLELAIYDFPHKSVSTRPILVILVSNYMFVDMLNSFLTLRTLSVTYIVKVEPIIHINLVNLYDFYLVAWFGVCFIASLSLLSLLH